MDVAGPASTGNGKMAEPGLVIAIQGALYEVANARGDTAAAMSHLRTSVEALRTLPGTEDAVSEQVFVMASLTEKAGDAAGARRLRFDALDAAIAAKNRQVAQDPVKVQPYLARATLLARTGRFKEAAADWEQVARIDPSQHWAWYCLACARLYLGDEPGYRAACEEMQKRFAADERREVPERTAKVALLLAPPAGSPSVGDPALVQRLVDRAIAPGAAPALVPWFNLCKSLAEYRAGRHDAAIEWAGRARTLVSAPGLATLDFITALAHHKAGRAQDARDVLAIGLERFNTQVPRPAVDDMGSSENYLVCEILRREAIGLIEPGRK
jgi:tetratricopeptide (TPR) repeat protein